MTNNSCGFYFQHCMVGLLAVVFKNSRATSASSFCSSRLKWLKSVITGFLSVFWKNGLSGLVFTEKQLFTAHHFQTAYISFYWIVIRLVQIIRFRFQSFPFDFRAVFRWTEHIAACRSLPLSGQIIVAVLLNFAWSPVIFIIWIPNQEKAVVLVTE